MDKFNLSNSRYILAKPIARGGMAEIFLAKSVGDDNFQRIVVAKRILNHFAKEKEFVEMFRDEAHVGKKLQHANIVQVYDFEEVDQSYAIIMEFVNGADFRGVLAAAEVSRMRIPVPMAISIVAMAARGLHYAHTKIDDITSQPLGIVHRDISPQNILVSYQGEVKVTDFGIADADGKITETQPGIVKGKYSYMSPEQISGKHVDARTDVFALSVVLWEALAMKRLFNGINEVETIKMVQNAKISEDLVELNPEVNEQLKAIVMKGLHKDQKKRFQSAGELENELLKFLNATYPEYNPRDISSFMTQTLADKKVTAQENIKSLLTQNNLKAVTGGYNTASTQSDRKIVHSSPSLVINLTEDETNSELKLDQLSISKQLPAPKGTTTHNTLSPTKYSDATKVPPSSARLKKRRQTAQLRKESPSIIISVAAMILIIAISYLIYQKFEDQFKSKSAGAKLKTVTISSVPQRVKIKINNKIINDGAYIQTPFTKKIPKNSKEILIERDGYIGKTINLDSSASFDHLITLQKKPNTKISFVVVESKKYKVSFDINKGFIKAKTPTSLISLPLNKKHILSGTVNANQETHEFKCSFTLKPTTNDRPIKLILDASKPKKTRCLLRNPKKSSIGH